MEKILILFVVLLIFLIVEAIAKKSRLNLNLKSDIQDDYKFENDKCAFYCFWIPEKNEKILFEVIRHRMNKLHCSHLIYGFSHIDSELNMIQPTSFDFIPDDYYGNFKRITSFRKNGTQLLYGIRVPLISNWIENKLTHEEIARKMVWHARGPNFNGIFLHVDSELLLGAGFEKFMSTLSKSIDADGDFYKRSNLLPLSVVLGISAEWVPHVASKLARIEHYFNAFYLWSDDTAIASDSAVSTSAASSSSSTLHGPSYLSFALRSSTLLTAAHVDPLETSKRILARDTIHNNAMQLVNEGGINYGRIIIGLTTWARSYIFSQTVINNAASALAAEKLHYSENTNETISSLTMQMSEESDTSFGHGFSTISVGRGGSLTRRSDGRLAFNEVCKISGFNTAKITTHAASASFLGPNRDWYSFNAPNSKSIGKKLKWIGAKGFGGVGLFSIQGDDAENACQLNEFPLHEYVAKNFRCNIARRNAARLQKNGMSKDQLSGANDARNPCTRICIVDTKHKLDTFTFERLKPEYCSHIIVSSLILNGENIGFTERFREIIDDYAEWLVDEKPLLILSIGASQLSRNWRSSIYIPAMRAELIENILHHVEAFNADGVDVSWTQTPPELPKDFASIADFIAELRQKMPSAKKIFATIATNVKDQADRLNVSMIANSVDYIIVEGFRFHSYRNYYTGHHSPLFAASDVLNNAKNTIEGAMNLFSNQGVDSHKLIAGLSAEALMQNFLTIADGITKRNEIRTRSNHSNKPRRKMVSHFVNYRRKRELAIDRQIGDRAAPYKKSGNRTYEFGAVTQTELCELLKDDGTRPIFIDEIGAPYLVSGKEFIAYDDERSIQMKTVWASMSDFGGVALNAIEMDNAGGVCPDNDPFHLLRTIATAQVCNICKKAIITNSILTNTTIGPIGNGTTKSETIDETVTKTNLTDLKQCPISNSKFRVICNYQLPIIFDSETLETNLQLNNLPFDDCDEIIVEEAIVKMSGEIVYATSKTENEEIVSKYLAPIKDLVREQRSIISTVRCLMSEKEFEKMISEPAQSAFIDGVVNHLNKYGFSGVEFRCDELMRSTETNRKFFSAFLQKLRKRLNNEKEENVRRDTFESLYGSTCNRTISLRVPVWRSNLKQNYNISDINTIIHHVTIEQRSSPKLPVEVFAAAAVTFGAAARGGEEEISAIVNPMFEVMDSTVKTKPTSLLLKPDVSRNFVVDTALRQLVELGVKRNVIVLQIPTYGILHKTTKSTMIPILTAKKSELEFLTNENVCKFLRNAGTKERWLYDRVSGFAKTSNNNQLSYETQKTIEFKTKYALRENLGGVVIDALNQDDFRNRCRNGKFALLKVARNTAQVRC